MIVVDANVIAYTLIAGERTASAVAVRKRDPSWVVPELWRHEFLSVVVQYVRFGGMSATNAASLLERAEALLLPAEQPVDLAAALSVAVQYSISAYDAQYIALAQALDIRCVTADAELLKKVPDIAVSMDSFCTADAHR
jgi:predicted nucleic acid-binding protein